MNSASLNEISYNVLNSLRGGRSSNTEHLSLEQVKFAIKYYRTTFIRRDFERNNNRFRHFEQDLGHLDLEQIDSSESDSIDSGNFILRTTNEIPTPVRLKRSEAITHISNRDKVGKQIPLLDAHRSYWNQFNKYTSDSTYATYRNGYVYVFSEFILDNINVRGVFEDPEEVYNFKNPDSIEPYDDSQPFPISTDMIEGITKGLLNGELKLAVTSLNDDETDLNQDEQ